jgi:1-aminocyclopropane-1-carboxylate deaminase/D-cysteine desulfhydrase-like pyridoxal-dependent ACC family enzyme
VSDLEQLTRKIRGALTPCSLGQWPTPLEPVAPALARALGLEALWVKREDRSSPRCGGNKVRGLEFLLAGAPAGSVFVTVGGTGSTHCLATAVHAAGLSCRAALAQFPQPETEASRAVAVASHAHAALVVQAASRAALPAALLRTWRGARPLGPRRWIPGGGAHPRAVVGHVLATLELDRQLPDPPDAIVAPLGTGGTVAGLLLGIARLGWPTRVIGVRVAPVLVANRWRTQRLARGARRLLARVGVALPAPRSADIVNALGSGYGWPTIDGESARRLAAAHDLILDPTYGAKAFAFLLHRGTRNMRRVLFWHTFAMPARLPESVR